MFAIFAGGSCSGAISGPTRRCIRCSRRDGGPSDSAFLPGQRKKAIPCERYRAPLRQGSRSPRYTSYPTAAEFTPAVGAIDQTRWLRGLDGSEPVSLYLHVPYCRELCLYCGCNTKKALRDDVIGGYREALEREIALVGETASDRCVLLAAALGRGTRASSVPKGSRPLSMCLRRHFVFEENHEHAIELDPRIRDAIAGGEPRKELGVTRASPGVQDVNPLVQAAIGRLQPMRDVEAAVTQLRAADIGNLNFDLIYGLPLQTVESLRKTCEIVAEALAGPHRLLRLCAHAAAQGQPAPHRRNDAARRGGADRPGPA